MEPDRNTAENVLVVVTGGVTNSQLRRAVSDLIDREARVLLVAPPELSRLQWLAVDVDDAVEEAEQRVEDAAAAVEAAPQVEAAETALHPDSDPVLAVKDALAQFPANRILLVTRPEPEAGWQERKLFDGELAEHGLPVAHVVAGRD